MPGELRKKTESALIWNSVNQFGTMGSRLIITIILARILTPEDFGLIAMILVVTSFSDLLINSGFKQGIVQQRKLESIELSSVFFLNIFVGLACTLIVFAVAPLIGSLYDKPELIPLTQVLSLVYLFKSFSIVQHGLMSREMDFKKRTISMLAAQVFSGIIAIIAAVNGFGVWSLIINLLLNDFLMSVIFWVQTSWKPQWSFKFAALKELWGFSSKILLMNVLSTLGNKVDLFFIGKLFNAGTLGLYSKGKDFAQLPSAIGSQVVTASFFPVFAKIQDNLVLFIESYQRLYKLLAMIFIPLFGIMFVGSEEIIFILLGEKWLHAIPYFKWGSIIGLFIVLNGFMINVINAKGRSDLNLKKTLIQVPLRITMFIAIPFIFDNFNPLFFIFGYIVFFISENIFNIFFISSITKTTLIENFILGLRYIIIGLFIVLLLQFTSPFIELNSSLLDLMTKATVFIVIYCMTLMLAKDKTLWWGLKQLKSKIN